MLYGLTNPFSERDPMNHRMKIFALVATALFAGCMADGDELQDDLSSTIAALDTAMSCDILATTCEGEFTCFDAAPSADGR